MKKKVIGDMLLNIIAVALPIAMLQLLLYPQIAKKLGGDEYGLMITIYSIWMIVSNSLGNVLNNIKLLKYPIYEKNKEKGDFLILLPRWGIANIIIVFCAIWVYCQGFVETHILLGALISIGVFLKAYLEVGFRIKLNYKHIVLNNAILTAGYVIGFLCFSKTGIWEFVFLIGFISSSVFCIVKTDLLQEPRRKTELYPEVCKDAKSLVIAALIGNLVNYADKLVLYPLMGGTAVSIYYTATILGKITGMVVNPINSVILSYITRWDKTRTSVFFKILIVGSIVLAFGYVATLLIARPVIGLLFPQWVEDVMEIIPLTTIAILISVLSAFLQPFVMKYCKLQWQIGISGIGSVTYFVCALCLWAFFGLKGFCVGTIIGALTKVVIMVIVYYRSTKDIVNSVE